MSKAQLQKTIQRQLKELNNEIDVKIVQGKAYRREARHHKMLLRQLAELNRGGLFVRPLGFFSFL